MSSEVEAWAERSGARSKGDALLAAYNEAVDGAEAEARLLLARSVESAQGKSAVIGLLNRQGTSDRERVLALEALEAAAEPSDVAELARVSVNQRSAAIPKTLEVLSTAGSPEAAFVLRRVFGEAAEESADVARALARELLAQEPVLATLQAGADVGDRARDALFVALALERSEQEALRVTRPREANPGLQAEASATDAALLASGRTGLSPYESILRRELHLSALVLGLNDDHALWDRANGTLFAADVDLYASLASLLPSAVVQTYFERATTEANRRKRPERTAVALRLASLLPKNAANALRPTLVELVRSPDDRIRFEAAVALATVYGDLSSDERGGLQEAYASLPAELQRRLAPHIGALGDEIAETEKLEDLIRWALAAPDTEVVDRLDRLVLRWSGVRTEDAAEFSRAVGELLNRLPESARLAQERSALEATLVWLRRRRAGVAAIRALDAWPRFGALVVANLELLAEMLSPARAERALAEVVAPDGHTSRGSLTALLAAELESDEARAIAHAVVAGIAMSDPDSLDGVFPESDEAGQRRIIAAGLQAHRDSMNEIDALETTLAEQSTRALVQRRKHVLAALDDAEQASSGNQALQREFGVIRRALGGVESDQPSGPSEAVRTWRLTSAERFPALVEAPADGSVPLAISAGSEDDDASLAGLMMELDQRAHARGTVPAADRPHYAADLQACARAFVALGALSRERERAAAGAMRRSPELSRMLEEARAEGLGSHVRTDIVRGLASERAAGEEQNVLRELQTVVAQAESQVISEVAADKRLTNLAVAWRRVVALARDSVRRRKKLEADVERQEHDAMARVADLLALPFQAIESYLFGYFRLRQILAEAGWGRAADHLGAELPREVVSRNLDRFEIRGEGSSERFLVRSLGITAGDETIHRAIVEALADDRNPDQSEDLS